MVDLADCLAVLLFFDIPLLYYHINLSSIRSITCCLFSGDICLSIGTFLSSPIFSVSFATVSKADWWSSWNFSNFVRNRIAKQISSCFYCFLNYSIWSSFKCICSRSFSMMKMFLTLFATYVFTYIFTNIFAHNFSQRQKFITFYKYWSLGSIE